MYNAAPLADRLRPQTLDDFVGQAHVVGPGKPLESLLKQGTLTSLILWGPPGTGKTTLARIIASQWQAEFRPFSAVTAGLPELRKVIALAEQNTRLQLRTVLFIDEIHRWNKSQQDALLPHVENGTLVLIGATTENPSFEVNGALLSRSTTFRLRVLSHEDLSCILDHALADEPLLSGMAFPKASRDFLISSAAGDARTLLNTLEMVASMVPRKHGAQAAMTPTRHQKTDEVVEEVSSEEEDRLGKRQPLDKRLTAKVAPTIRRVSRATLETVLSQKATRYDKGGEEHYNVISAFIKSMRGSDADAALYYLARMLDAGEDPKFIARRMIIFASEDVGNADSHRLLVATAAFTAVERIGLPEARINLAHAVTFLAAAPKSNASYKAIDAALAEVRRSGALPVPLHLRNAPTNLMKKEGYHEGYEYAHNQPKQAVSHHHLPDQLAGTVFYHPTDHGHEKKVAERLEEVRRAQQPKRGKK